MGKEARGRRNSVVAHRGSRSRQSCQSYLVRQVAHSPKDPSCSFIDFSSFLFAEDATVYAADQGIVDLRSRPQRPYETQLPSVLRGGSHLVS